MRFHLIMSRIDDRGQHGCLAAVAAKQVSEILVSRHDEIRVAGDGKKSPPGMPALQRADRPAVVHHGVIDVEKKLASSFSQQTGIEGIEHLPLQKHGIVIRGGFEQSPPGQHFARADVYVEAYAPLLQPVAQGLDVAGEMKPAEGCW